MALAEYLSCFSQPEAIHGACEDYRASATVDMALDAESVQACVQIACELLVLWGTRGVIHALFDPMALWRARCAGKVTGEAMEAGHYLAEELPDDTSQRLLRFFGG